MKRKLTIVGPEPAHERNITSGKSRNIEALLLMAKYNRSFRRKLLRKPNQAITTSGLNFSDNELLLLQTAKAEQLKVMINSFHISGITPKSLKSWKVAATVLILISSLAAGKAEVLSPKKEIYSIEKPVIKLVDLIQRLGKKKQRQYIIKGIVTDSVGEPLIGVNIMIKGTSQGTITCMGGEFQIDAELDDILVFSYMGYLTIEIPVDRDYLSVILREDPSFSLDNIIVVSYGVSPSLSRSERIARRKERRANRKEERNNRKLKRNKY